MPELLRKHHLVATIHKDHSRSPGRGMLPSTAAVSCRGAYICPPSWQPRSQPTPTASAAPRTSGMICWKCCCRQVALGMPTSALTATACLLSDDSVTWSKSTRRNRPTPDRNSRWAAWLPTPCRDVQQGGRKGSNGGQAVREGDCAGRHVMLLRTAMLF